MPILDEIEHFFAQQASWQRRVYGALRNGEVITDTLLSEFVDGCINEAKSGAQVVSQRAEPTAQSKDKVPVVQLVSVANVQRIGNLASSQLLSFASEGLTVVYGDNGAGKSGYGCILRQVCRARGVTPELRGNVFLELQASGTADVTFSIDGIENVITVKSGQTTDGPLRRVSIFDSYTAASLVNEQNTAAFRPFGLDLLDQYAGVADSIKARLERELLQTDTSLLRVEEFPQSTSAGRLVRELGAGSIPKDLSLRFSPLSLAEENRLQELRTIIAQSRANDPTKLSKAVGARALRYEQLARRLEGLSNEYGLERIREFIQLREETQVTEHAAETARTLAFSEESLPEVGSATWRRMWDAAREYGRLVAEKLVEPKADELCVFCAQPLSLTAAQRIQTLETFVQGELQAKAKSLRKRLTGMLEQYNSQPFYSSNDDSLIQELATDDGVTASEVDALLKKAKVLTRQLQVFHATGEAPSDEGLPPVPPALVALAAILRGQATALLQLASESTLASFEGELSELESHKRLITQEEIVRKEATRISRRAILEKAKRSTSTRAVSELSTYLTGKYVSEALCDRFRSEINRLGVQLNVELASVGTHKAKLFHRIILRAKQDAPLREVVSEGEFRCLALAAFMAEVGGSASGILFDDPVSSLDHTWRQRIATRLAEEARTRQIIVFTHDITFHFLLREAAEAAHINVRLTERCIERRGRGEAGYCREDAPWAGMKTTKRIGVLKNEIVALKKQYEEGEVAYERNIRDWYGRLREGWERAIEECLLNDAIRRFSHSVQTNRLARALEKVHPGDWVAIEKGMTRASSALRGHDGARDLNPPIPTPNEASQDLAEFDAWVKTKN